MRRIALLISGLIVGVLCFSVAGADQDDEARDFVQRAIQMVKDRGIDRTLRAIDDPNGPFVKNREAHAVAGDCDRFMLLAHPFAPRKWIGVNLSHMRAPKIQAIFSMMCQRAKHPGQGWIDFRLRRPSTGRVERKRAFIRRVPGTTKFVGFAFFPSERRGRPQMVPSEARPIHREPDSGISDLPVAYQENFDHGQARGWNLEPGWRVEDGQLRGNNHYWARYGPGLWRNSIVSFRLSTGFIHANVRVSPVGRYFVRFISVGEDRLEVALCKQLWPDVGGRLRITDLTKTTIDRPGRGWDAAIQTVGGRIEVFVNHMQLLDYTDPDPLPPGTIAFETHDGSYAAVDDIIVRTLDRGPDLAVLSADRHDFERNNDLLRLYVEVGNVGDILSKDSELIVTSDAFPGSLGKSPVPQLREGDEAIVEVTVKIPDQWRGTRQILRLRVRQVPGELNLTNNVNSTPDIMIPERPKPRPAPVPDLTIYAPDYGSFDWKARSLWLSVRVKNLGDAKSERTVFRVKGDSDGVQVGERSLEPLQRGEEATVGLNLKIPEDWIDVTQRLILAVAPVAAERNRDNNQVTTPPIAFPKPKPKPVPDLSIYAPDYKSFDWKARLLLLSVRVKNVGNAESVRTVLRVKGDSDGVQVGEVSLAPLQHGEETTVGLKLTIPEDWIHDTQRLILAVDPVPEERNQDNNQVTTPPIPFPQPKPQPEPQTTAATTATTTAGTHSRNQSQN